MKCYKLSSGAGHNNSPSSSEYSEDHVSVRGRLGPPETNHAPRQRGYAHQSTSKYAAILQTVKYYHIIALIFRGSKFSQIAALEEFVEKIS